jgi:hypothetical protein
MYIALSGFAISCASLANQGTLDSSFLEIFFTFVIVIFSCCAYSFKKHDIFFNYSIMEDEHYYKKVFINVGKLAVNMFIFMTISLSANILISINTVTRNSWHAMLSIFSTYTYVFIILALAYIIYSYLEKSSYDNESFSLSYAPFITLIISVVLSLISLIFYLKISSPYLTEETAFITGILNNTCTVCLVAFATYFSYEIQKERKNLAAKTGELIYILSISISSVLNSFFASVHHLIFQVTVQHNHNHSEETKEIFQNIKKLLFDQTNIMEITNDIVAAAQFLSVIILISILIKKGFISEKHYLICAVIFFICTADIISRNIFNVYDDASNLFKISIFKCIVFIGMIVYCAAVVFNISRKKRNNALKEE